jgi:hypothetical protein
MTALPVPESKHVGVDLFRGGHPGPPPERAQSLQYRSIGERTASDAAAMLSQLAFLVAPAHFMSKLNVGSGSIAQGHLRLSSESSMFARAPYRDRAPYAVHQLVPPPAWE